MSHILLYTLHVPSHFITYLVLCPEHSAKQPGKIKQAQFKESLNFLTFMEQLGGKIELQSLLFLLDVMNLT